MGKLDSLLAVHRHPDRKPWGLILAEVLATWRREGEPPRHYVEYGAYRKGVEVRDFATLPQTDRLQRDYFLGQGRDPELLDKRLFAHVMESLGVPTPPVLAVVDHGELVPARPADDDAAHPAGETAPTRGVPVATPERLQAGFADLQERTGHPELFVKPVDGNQGRGAFVVGPGGELPEHLRTAVAPLTAGTFLVQPRMRQHPALSALYPHAVNTVRVHTHRDADGTVRLTSALLRVGAGGAATDNTSSGGLYAPLDTETWTVTGPGMTRLAFGGRTHLLHPDTGTRFHGLVLPHAERIGELVLRAAEHFRGPFLGWDVGLAEEDAVIIEGNDCPDPNLNQLATGGFRVHPVHREIFRDWVAAPAA